MKKGGGRGRICTLKAGLYWATFSEEIPKATDYKAPIGLLYQSPHFPASNHSLIIISYRAAYIKSAVCASVL